MGVNASENVAREKPLGVTDIEFRGEVIYFIVVDRFFDGDPNNDSGQDPNLYDPERKDYGKYWGGDLEGVIQKLEYLDGMGVTSVWLTPLFEQIEAMVWDSAPIHGYWTRDFKRIHARWVKGEDEVRFFARDDTTLDRSIAGLHERGMKMVLDIVCNHSSPDASGVKGQLFDDGKLIADFHNDVDHWYHHYEPVTDWQNDWQVKNCELAGLATFNENTWQGGLAFEQTAGEQVTYKYMIIRQDGGDGGAEPPRRENRTTRRRVVPRTGTAKWRDIWEE